LDGFSIEFKRVQTTVDIAYHYQLSGTAKELIELTGCKSFRQALDQLQTSTGLHKHHWSSKRSTALNFVTLANYYIGLRFYESLCTV